MTETFVAHVNGSFACYQTRTGIDRAFIGCTHQTPRQAIDHTTREEDTDALYPDRAGVALVGPASRSGSDVTLHDAAGESRQSLNEASGLPVAAGSSPRRPPAPAGSFPREPVGAPSPERVP